MTPLRSGQTAKAQRILWLGLALLLALTVLFIPLWLQHAAAASHIYYVKPAASGAADGSTWENAATLQYALGNAINGDEIWVAAGTYLPGAAESDSFNLVPGVAVYGGFAGTEATLAERDWAANLTILGGDIGDDDTNKVNGVVMDAAGIVGNNSDHVVVADGTTGPPVIASTILDGFTITAGQADGGGSDDNGGGFLCLGSGTGGECSPRLRNISFSGNAAATNGGALANFGGGGSSSPRLTNVSFFGNTAGNNGGAILNNGVSSGDSSPRLTNVSFSHNAATNNGGAMFSNGSNGGSSSPILTNVIMWGDSAGSGGPEIAVSNAGLTVTYSLIAGQNPPGTGNLNGTIPGNNPLFVDAANGDLRLEVGSPAVDAGDDSAPGLSGILTDLDGNDRFVDGDGDETATVDMGAYENQTVCPATTTLFVDSDAGGSGSGSDWNNAQPDLALALERAAVCDVAEIWVAGGTYVPGAAESDSFDLAPGVAVYGGFDGTEAALVERDWEANLTILSGDIGDDDIKVNGVVTDTAGIVGANSFHVVLADGTTGTPITATTKLDGFTITAGQADGGGLDNNGGGFHCTGNSAGGDCSPSLSNLSFSGNTAENNGGALRNQGGSGGSSSPSLNNVSFSGNTAGNNGGAILNGGASGSSSPSLTNVSFSNNEATNYGGAMFNNGDGGVSSPSLTNVSFSGNSADYGGAMYNDGYGGFSSPSLTNVSFSGNTVGVAGGAMFNNGYGGFSSPSLTNVIMWGDSAPTGPEIVNNDATATISSSLIAGGVGSIYGAVNGGGNLSDDPLFFDAANGDLRLAPGSPAIDAGDDSASGLAGILTDLDGNPRFVDGDGDETATVDMGAYENQTVCPATTTLFVNHAAGGSGSGSDWTNAQPDLALALERAAVCDVAEVWVAAGTYVPGAAESDSFNLAPGVAVYGGFAGTEAALVERDWAANLTILSGDIGDDDIKVNGVVTHTAGIVGNNSDHVLFADGTTGTPITATTKLDGFTITAGQADGGGSDANGGGFHCTGNSAGGECSPSLTNVSFSGNAANNNGGAIFNGGFDGGVSSPSLSNVAFSGNTAGNHGGAMCNFGLTGSSSPSLSNVAFSGNTAGNHGGAMFNYGASGVSSPSLTNISFSGNTADYGGAMVNDGLNGVSSPSLTNVIMWGDSANTDGNEIANNFASTRISNSLIAGGVGSIIGAVDGGGNLSDDPLFLDAANGDLRLAPGGPAIDVGDDSAPGLAGILTDLDGNDRFVDGDGDETATVDMGAYEAQLQAVPLAGGWNLISLYRQPDDLALEAVLAGIEPDLVLLKNGAGQVYWPAYGINQIGDWSMEEGYQVYLNAPLTLSVSGAQVVPAQTPITLAAGWNMAAYLRDSQMAIATALAGIETELLLVKNGDGDVYWPDMTIDDIGNMLPGQGYQIFMDNAASLTYPPN